MIYTKICSSRYYLQLCSWKVFYLKLFRAPNMCSKFIDFEIQKLELVNDLIFLGFLKPFIDVGT